MSDERTVQEIPAVVRRLRAGFDSGQTKPLSWRKTQLQRLVDMCIKHRDNITSAINRDLKVLGPMANLMEVGSTIQEARAAIANLDSWAAPTKRDIPLIVRPAKGRMGTEPYGVALIIGPWNYPFRLLSFPLVGALAAGNTVLLKPSEVSAHTSAAIKAAISEFFPPDVVAVVEGGVTVSQALLQQRFDYIFYTGNAEVGRIVMRAAAENLTPVTLELGGKSPVYVDKSAKLDVAARRILFGKFTNAGQTCVAPDYVLVDRAVKDELLAKLKTLMNEWYGPDPSKVSYFSRIISARHAHRLARFIEENRASVVQGGRSDINERYIEPTLLLEPSMDGAIMREEIFGPILPIFAVDGPEAAVKAIRRQEKPLALYVFAENDAVPQFVIDNTSSGGVGINNTILHVGCSELPFGGVGNSGTGAYQGRASFETFSHHRAVLDKATWIDLKAQYPPLKDKQLAMLDKMADGFHVPAGAVAGAAAVVLGVGAYVIKSRL